MQFFAAIWALMYLAWTVRVGPLKFWAVALMIIGSVRPRSPLEGGPQTWMCLGAPKGVNPPLLTMYIVCTKTITATRRKLFLAAIKSNHFVLCQGYNTKVNISATVNMYTDSLINRNKKGSAEKKIRTYKHKIRNEKRKQTHVVKITNRVWIWCSCDT